MNANVRFWWWWRPKTAKAKKDDKSSVDLSSKKIAEAVRPDYPHKIFSLAIID